MLAADDHVRARPYDKNCRVFCLDEMNKRRVGEDCMPIPASPERAGCHHYEYARNGTAPTSSCGSSRCVAGGM